MESHFAGEQRVYDCAVESECWGVLRSLSAHRNASSGGIGNGGSMLWRDRYSYVLADKVEFDESTIDAAAVAMGGDREQEVNILKWEMGWVVFET